MIANLDVLGPVPNDIGEERLVLCQSEGVADSSKWRVDAVAGMDVQHRSQVGKYFAPSTTATNRFSRGRIKCLPDAAVVLAKSRAGEQLALKANRACEVHSRVDPKAPTVNNIPNRRLRVLRR